MPDEEASNRRGGSDEARVDFCICAQSWTQSLVTESPAPSKASHKSASGKLLVNPSPKAGKQSSAKKR